MWGVVRVHFLISFVIFGRQIMLKHALKHTLTAALALFLASPVFAQAQSPSTPTDPSKVDQHDGFVEAQHATDWRSSKLIGTTVYGADNASIGEINELLIDNEGKVRAAVIGVGGFLGVGEKNVAIPLDAFNISRKPESNMIDKITVSYSKHDLKNAPTFAYYEPAVSRTTGVGASDKLNSLNPLSQTK